MQNPENPTQTKSSNPKDLLAAGEARVPLDLIPGPALVHLALAMRDGAVKYGPYNWREEGVGARTYVAAARRHILAWLDGEENAQDSKRHHLAHAMACLAILLDAQAVGNLVDDRPPAAPTAEMMEAVKKGGPGSQLSGTWRPPMFAPGDRVEYVGDRVIVGGASRFGTVEGYYPAVGQVDVRWDELSGLHAMKLEEVRAAGLEPATS